MLSNMVKENKKEIKNLWNWTAQGVRGKRIVILGDQTGIGQAVATKLVEQGAKVFIAAPSGRDLTALFATIARTGGEWDGIVADLSRPEEIRRFFDLAETRLGQIDVVVNHLPAALGLDHPLAGCQNLCMAEAIERLAKNSSGTYKGGHIINIGEPGSPSVSPTLRRQASECGIRITLISSEEGGAEVSPVEDIARCVSDVLSQSFGIDMIFLPPQKQIL